MAGAKPKLLKPDVAKTILTLVEAGNTDVDACLAGGVSTTTFYAWQQEVREVAEGKRDASTVSYYLEKVEFSDALTRARAIARQRAVEAIRNAIAGYDSKEVTIESGYRDVDGKIIEVEITKTKSWRTAPDAKIALEYLARRYPDEWGKRVELAGSTDKPIDIRVTYHKPKVDDDRD